MNEERLRHAPSSFAGRAGVARRDVTPPVGIYNRMWGAATHDTATGVHRPITATALALWSREAGAEAAAPLLLISLDWCHLAHEGDRAALMSPLIELVGGDAARVILACTHTHGVGFINSARIDQPGGELIRPYLDTVRDRLREAATEAIERARTTPATLTWAMGRCALAANRDLPDPDPQRERDLVGFNPQARDQADDALLVGRVTRDVDDRPLATIVNYACHPTTLAWENTKLSPDYVGAMRELVESATAHAPCLFLQGASGELAPAHQYVGDPAVADGHGRAVGHAVLGVLASMLPPRRALVHERTVESGAPLAVWRPEAFEPPRAWHAMKVDVELPLKSMPTLEAIDRELAGCADRAQAERLRRRRELVEKVGSGPHCAMPLWVWRLGDAVLVAQCNEAYSDLQRELRAAFGSGAGGGAVAVMNVANGACGYLYPRRVAERDIYPVWQSPFAPGALEVLIERAREAIAACGEGVSVSAGK